MTKYPFFKEDGIASTQEKMFIPSLEKAMPIWVYAENEHFNDFSPKQKKAFETFFNAENILTPLQVAIENYYQRLCREGAIEKSENDNFCFEYQAIIVPNQQQTPDDFIYLIAQTNWQKANAKHYLELEIGFQNTILFKIEELSGDYTFPH